ncbi:response regulator [Caproicibacter sp.]|uniref:response regulator n=1 Tax=Caproicibacter sp. TaxID=2814884 RepID=UPI00398A1CCA
MLKAILVDDELPALEELEYQLEKYKTVTIAAKIQDSRAVLERVEEIRPDLIFLDIDLPGTNGLELALKIQDLCYGIIIVFITAYSEYALQAFQAYPLDYILKPADEKRLRKTMEQILRQKEGPLVAEEAYHTVIRCFNHFETFSDNTQKIPIKFSTRYAKELFAYLICHFETDVTRNELMHNIFDGKTDKKTINLLHVTIYRLRRSIAEAQISRDTIQISGSYRLEAADGVCDYIDFCKFIKRNPYIDASNIQQANAMANLYSGAYLQSENYIWAEEIRTEMELKYETLILKMVEFYYGTGEFDAIERLLNTLIHYNPLSEAGNRSLLEFYMRQENREKFEIQYGIYEKILKNELQIRPERKFVIFHQIATR